MTPRHVALDAFYKQIEILKHRIGGPRLLRDPTAKAGLPQSGVYLFFEHGEVRGDGITPRVVRVGTHGLDIDAKSTLWSRLRQHRGTVGGKRPEGGDHRSSVFRKHIGDALLAKHPGHWAAARSTWGVGNSAKAAIKDDEHCLELEVSAIIRQMPFLWVEVSGDEAAKHKADLEQNLIALLSNLDVAWIDPPSASWLGHHSSRAKICGSGLWNSDFVDAHGYRDVATALGEAVAHTRAPSS